MTKLATPRQHLLDRVHAEGFDCEYPLHGDITVDQLADELGLSTELTELAIYFGGLPMVRERLADWVTQNRPAEMARPDLRRLLDPERTSEPFVRYLVTDARLTFEERMTMAALYDQFTR